MIRVFRGELYRHILRSICVTFSNVIDKKRCKKEISLEGAFIGEIEAAPNWPSRVTLDFSSTDIL